MCSGRGIVYRFAHGAAKATGGGEGGDDDDDDEGGGEGDLEAPPQTEAEVDTQQRPRSDSLSSSGEYLVVALSICVLIDVSVCAAVVVGKCHGCSVPWDKYRGRKRCPVCGVPLLLCPACLENTPPDAKCTLCKEDAALGRRPFTKANHRREVAAAGSILGGPEGGNGGRKKDKQENMCGVCQEKFKSRNALFKHLNDTGHKNRKAKKNKGPLLAK